MQRYSESTKPAGLGRASSAAREYLWFAGMLIVLLASAAVRSPGPGTASANLITAAP